jgi:hypothetical protein
MSYGLKVKNKQGATVLKIDDRISRLVWKSEITNASGSQVISELSGKKSNQFALITDNAQFMVPPDVTRSGNTISWTARTAGLGYLGESPPNCVIFVFIYD